MVAIRQADSHQVATTGAMTPVALVAMTLQVMVTLQMSEVLMAMGRRVESQPVTGAPRVVPHRVKVAVVTVLAPRPEVEQSLAATLPIRAVLLATARLAM